MTFEAAADSMSEDSADAREGEAPAEPLSDEWLAEIERRSAEYDAGRMPASSWPEVRARTRQQAGLDQ
jgi:putative addiction module component (TIGR02574 family)